MNYLILNASAFPLRKLLGPVDQIPAEARLGVETNPNHAGVIASRAVAGTLVLGGTRPVDAIVRPEDDDLSAGPVIHYSRAYESAHRTGRHRYLCSAYPKCENPSAPWMYYCPPSKNQKRVGPQVCKECRRTHPTDAYRGTLAKINVSRKRESGNG